VILSANVGVAFVAVLNRPGMRRVREDLGTSHLDTPWHLVGVQLWWVERPSGKPLSAADGGLKAPDGDPLHLSLRKSSTRVRSGARKRICW
jgi:hypothetical protein